MSEGLEVEMTKINAERRRFPRVTSSNPILVAGPDSDGDRTLHETGVVGMNGLMFRSEKSYGRGTVLQMDLAVHDRIVEVVGKVAYERITVVGDLEIGVEFTRVNNGDRHHISSLLRMSA